MTKNKQSTLLLEAQCNQLNVRQIDGKIALN